MPTTAMAGRVAYEPPVIRAIASGSSPPPRPRRSRRRSRPDERPATVCAPADGQVEAGPPLANSCWRASRGTPRRPRAAVPPPRHPAASGCRAAGANGGGGVPARSMMSFQPTGSRRSASGPCGRCGAAFARRPRLLQSGRTMQSIAAPASARPSAHRGTRPARGAPSRWRRGLGEVSSCSAPLIAGAPFRGHGIAGKGSAVSSAGFAKASDRRRAWLAASAISAKRSRQAVPRPPARAAHVLPGHRCSSFLGPGQDQSAAKTALRNMPPAAEKRQGQAGRGTSRGGPQGRRCPGRAARRGKGAPRRLASGRHVAAQRPKAVPRRGFSRPCSGVWVAA